MCTKVKCRTCGKATWSGCGDHIEYALYGVPESERCQGHEGESKETGLFSRLLGMN